MVNGPLVFGSGKLCNSYSKPQKPRLGQFFPVSFLTRHRPSVFFLHSSLAKTYHMPRGQFFDKERQYLGPLPTFCGHSTHAKRLLGQLPSGKWATEGSAAYPPALCKYLAELIASRVGERKGPLSLGLHAGPITEAEPTTTTTTVAAGSASTVTTDSLDQPDDSDTKHSRRARRGSQ